MWQLIASASCRSFILLLYLESRFLSLAYLPRANLAQFIDSVHCQVSARFQYLVRLLSFYCITGGHTIHPPIRRLVTPTSTEHHLQQTSPVSMSKVLWYTSDKASRDKAASWQNLHSFFVSIVPHFPHLHHSSVAWLNLLILFFLCNFILITLLEKQLLKKIAFRKT